MTSERSAGGIGGGILGPTLQRELLTAAQPLVKQSLITFVIRSATVLRTTVRPNHSGYVMEPAMTVRSNVVGGGAMYGADVLPMSAASNGTAGECSRVPWNSATGLSSSRTYSALVVDRVDVGGIMIRQAVLQSVAVRGDSARVLGAYLPATFMMVRLTKACRCSSSVIGFRPSASRTISAGKL